MTSSSSGSFSSRLQRVFKSPFYYRRKTSAAMAQQSSSTSTMDATEKAISNSSSLEIFIDSQGRGYDGGSTTGVGSHSLGPHVGSHSTIGSHSVGLANNSPVIMAHHDDNITIRGQISPSAVGHNHHTMSVVESVMEDPWWSVLMIDDPLTAKYLWYKSQPASPVDMKDDAMPVVGDYNWPDLLSSTLDTTTKESSRPVTMSVQNSTILLPSPSSSAHHNHRRLMSGGQLILRRQTNRPQPHRHHHHHHTHRHRHVTTV